MYPYEDRGKKPRERLLPSRSGAVGVAFPERYELSVVPNGIAGSTTKLRLCSADGAALRVNRYTPKAAIKICAAMIVCDRPRWKDDIANPAMMGPATAPAPCTMTSPPEEATNSPSATESFT